VQPAAAPQPAHAVGAGDDLDRRAGLVQQGGELDRALARADHDRAAAVELGRLADVGGVAHELRRELGEGRRPAREVGRPGGDHHAPRARRRAAG
jgi:hypothetical protein